jgi:predicted TIM-barrel fold metal-dependent hydrolase
MIIDGHCHAGRGDGLTGPWDTFAPLEAYLERAAAAGIDRTVVFPAFHSDYRIANRELGPRLRGPQPRLTGFAFVNAERDRGRVGDLVREAVEEHGFRGLKVHRHDARISREICESARRWSLPVLYDVMGEVSSIELFATEYRDVNFIVPHLGSFADDWQAQRACIDALARHPNVYCDTSGVRRFDLLVEAVRRAGPGKIIFGSDGPFLHPGVELFKVRALRLGCASEEQVTGGNLLRLLALSDRRGRAASPAREPGASAVHGR